MRLPSKVWGFTLLEVMVATAIIAFALAAIIRSTGMNTANVTYLRDKTFAHWVAMNHMAELEASNTYPSLGRKSGEEEIGGKEWHWTAEVKNTPDKDIRRVEIEVRQERRRAAPTVTVLTGFFSRHRGTSQASQ